MNQKKSDIGLVYHCIHDKLMKQAGKVGHLKRKEVMVILAVSYRIPKNLRQPVLRELVQMGLVHCPNSQVVIPLNNDFNLKNTSQIYKKLNFY